ncbi:Glycerol-3-phosphate cytidylyltransferase [Pseudobutyrivibrio sp. 49]|uniref:adenylyltransferase/cytidyltransferase family protein n=1 Tax=Pseudobutyrivibrio sp. 49 TaxID=1855344 RepID=UPI00088F67B3|nr:adenylyltransferase/cytidyltransferase family protein [Pseudobutyrivibrio sp. 49]SDI72125.1 Glycerol-3-phosphate cytidylyltransferase [Pseudobutyrivibrio sp. 49]
MKKYKVGYTQGVYDMFHIGHLNLLNHAKEYCDYLVVGVNSDQLVQEYKNKKTVIGEDERLTIVENIKAVDEGIIVNSLDKEEVLKQVHFDVVFIGDDWKGSKRWNETEEALAKHDVDVVYLKHTDGISSTLLRTVEGNAVKDN